jgi:hypothetical protein
VNAYPLHHKLYTAIVCPMTPQQVADLISSTWPACTVEVATDVLSILRERRGIPVERKDPRPMARTWRTVVRLVCEVYDVPEEELISRRRTKRVAEARFALFSALVDVLRFSFSDVADVIRRDQTTVAYGYQRADKLSERYLTLLALLDVAMVREHAEAAE